MTGAALDPSSRRPPRFDALPDLVFEVDAGSRIVAVHVGRQHDLHASPADFLDRPVGDVIAPDLVRTFEAARAEAHRNQTSVSYEYRLPNQAGEVLDFEGRCVPLPEGSTLVVVRNVTVRRERRAAAALSALQLSVDASTDLANVAGLVEWLVVQVREGVDDDQADQRRERADAMLDTLGEVEEAIARLRRSAADLGGDAARRAGRAQGPS